MPAATHRGEQLDEAASRREARSVPSTCASCQQRTRRMMRLVEQSRERLARSKAALGTSLERLLETEARVPGPA